MPFMKPLAPHYRIETIARRRSVPTMIPARKYPKCHGFGHWASECTTETLIIFTPDARIIEVEEEKRPIWDEDPFEELPEPIWDEYSGEEPQYNVEEVSWSTPEIKSSEVTWDDIPCMIIPPEPSETRLQLLPCGISQPQELFAAPKQTHHTVNIVTREALHQLHSHDLSRDLFEIEPIEMILPPDPLKSEVQLLLGHNNQTPMEYKYLPDTIIPNVDLTWVWVKSKKVHVGSISKLMCKASIYASTQGETTDPTMMKASPPPGENERVGPA